MQEHRPPQGRLYESRPASSAPTAPGPDDDASHLPLSLPDTSSWLWPFEAFDNGPSATAWSAAPAPALDQSFVASAASNPNDNGPLRLGPTADAPPLATDRTFDPHLQHDDQDEEHQHQQRRQHERVRQLALRQATAPLLRQQHEYAAAPPHQVDHFWHPAQSDHRIQPFEDYWTAMNPARYGANFNFAVAHDRHDLPHHHDAPHQGPDLVAAPEWMSHAGARDASIAPSTHPSLEPITRSSAVDVLTAAQFDSHELAPPLTATDTDVLSQSIVSAASTAAPGPNRVTKKRKRLTKRESPDQASDMAAVLWKGRRGPLDESTREKSRSLRQYGACWRCRKYRKPCSSGPEICETCITSGFRVWPSELGCRRGNLDSYVDVFLPTNAEFVFQSSPLGNKRLPWRRLLDASTITRAQNAAALSTDDRRWSMLIHKALGTRIFGPEFVELFEIVAKYQQTAPREHPALDAACNMLNSTTDFYYTFVHVDGDETMMQDPLSTVRTIRKSFARALRMILSGCLSGRANEWLPCLLACCMLAAAVICFTDAAFQIPPDVRQAIWTDVGAMVQSIKGSLYTTIVHLLTALAKGGKPLQMSCWRIEETTDPETGEVRRRRNEHGMKLLANEETSFDAVKALQEWLFRHGDVVTIGRVWSSSQPFSQAQIPAIAIMGALFDA